MHADFHELSEIAIGRRAAGPHVAECSDCRAELGRIRRLRRALRELPDVPPPPASLAELREQLAQRHGVAQGAPAGLALAASLLVAAAAALLFAGSPIVGTSGDQPIPAGAPLDGLLAENARLEDLLASLPATRTTRAATAYTVGTLEDQLAMVDDRLTTASLQPSAPELAEDLWRERVTLMNSLVQVRYANAVAAR